MKLFSMLFIIILLITCNLNISAEKYSLENEYYQWIKKEELLNADWDDSTCKNQCIKYRKYFDSTKSRVISGNHFILIANDICDNKCNGTYYYNKYKNKIYQITNISFEYFVREQLLDEEYYFTMFSYNEDRQKYIEQGILLLYGSNPFEYRDYKFEKNFSPRKVEKCDSLFCVTVYEYESECNWSLLHLILPRGRPSVYNHLYINSYLYKFDDELNLIEIEKLPINKKEWKESRDWPR